MKLYVLFVCFLLISSYSNVLTDDSSPLPKVTPHNWVEISPSEWPTFENGVDSKNPFFLIHTENSENFPFLKKGLINPWPTVSTPELHFKYWASHDLAKLRAELQSEKLFDQNLEHKKQWTTTTFSIKNASIWNSLALVGTNGRYTLGLKNIQVEYINKIPVDKLPSSSVHGFQPQSAFSLTNINNNNPIKILSVATKTATIEIINPIIIKNVTTDLLQFQFVSMPGGDLTNIKLTLSNDKTSCDTEPENFNNVATFQCDITNKTFQFLTVNLKSGSFFAIFDPKQKQILSKQNEKEIRDVLLNSYVIFKDSQPDNRDVCYTVERENDVPMDIFFTFSNFSSGTHLISTKEQNINFCVNDFLALKNLKNFQITLFIHGKMPQNFVLKRKSSTENFYVKSPNPELKSNFCLTKNWFYFNPLLDYSIIAENSQKSNNLWLCDIENNCFLYRKTKIQDKKHSDKNYTLFSVKTEVLKLLLKSPFVRIKSLERNFKFQKFNYFTESKNIILNKLKTKMINISSNNLEQNFFSLIKEIKFQKVVENQNGYQLTIPFDSIDHRFYHLVILIKNNEPKSHISVANVTVSSKKVSDLTNIFNLKFGNLINTENGLTISTDKLFTSEPHQIESTKNVNLIINLRVPENVSQQLTSNVEITIQVKDNENTEPETSATKYTIFPENLKIENNFTVLNSTNTKALISTLLIRSPYNRKLDNFNFSIEFKNVNLTTSDYQIFRLILSNGNLLSSKNLSEKLSNNTLTEIFSQKDQTQNLLEGNTYQIMYLLEWKNKNESLHFKIKNFEIYPCDEKQTVDGPMIATFNLMYNPFTCVGNFEKAENKSICELKNVFKEETINCDANDCSNIFNSPLLKSSLYSTKTGKPRYAPYQMNKSLVASSYLKVEPHFDENHLNFDNCITFNYHSTNSKLTVTQLNSKYTIDFSAGKSPQNGKICQSWFALEIASVKTFYFQLPDNVITNIDHSYFTILSSNWETLYHPLTKGTRKDVNDKTQNTVEWQNYFFEKPDGFNLDKHNEIEYIIKDLQTLKTKSSHHISKLRTRWIKAIPSRQNEVRLTLNPSGDYQKEFLAIDLSVISSTKGTLFKKPISDLILSNSSIIKLKFSEIVDSYYLTFVYNIDLSKVTNENSASVKFSNITINDACIDEQTNKEEVCNHVGTCKAIYNEFKPVCECNPGFNGPSCTTTDYCTKLNSLNVSNSETCKKAGNLKCINKEKLSTFLCECNVKLNETWNAITNSCMKPFPTCGEQEELKIENGQPVCRCVEGMISYNGVCVEYDVCNEDYRKINREKIIKPCATERAECKRKNKNDFECLCKTGYYNEFELKDNSATCLADICRSCHQTCSFNTTLKEFACSCAKNYKLDAGTQQCVPDEAKVKLINKCLSNETIQEEGIPQPFLGNSGICTCSSGFIFENKNKSCILNERLFQKKFTCDKVEIKKLDHQPGCVCSEDQKFDTSSRRCLMECSEDKTKFCEDKLANCEYTSAAGARCQCKNNGFVAFNENATDIDSYKCTDKCELLNKPQLTNLRCTGKFQHCDNLMDFTFDNLIDGVFYLGNSTISSNSQHCACDLGFERQDKNQTLECTVASKPIRFIKNMEFDVPAGLFDNSAKKNYVASVEPAFVALIKTLFGEVVEKETHCDLKEEAAHCTTAFPTMFSDKQIKEKLTSSCHLLVDNKTCSYVAQISDSSVFEMFEKNELFVSTSKTSAIVLNHNANDEIILDSVHYCQANNDRCGKILANSHCVPKDNYFECLCDPKLFDVQTFSALSVPNSKTSLQMQSCKLKDLCVSQPDLYGCADPSAKCSLHLTQENGEDKVQTFCSCPNSGITLPSKDRLCSASCGDKCVYGDCAIDVFNLNKVICQCHPGFEGNNCEKMIQDSESETYGVSKGYQTATIILSIFFSLGLLALVFVVVKKFTGFNVVLYINQLIRRE